MVAFGDVKGIFNVTSKKPCMALIREDISSTAEY